MASSRSDSPPRAPRADVLRNRAKLLTAARAAFAEHGTEASLEDIARRAEVGIGTLYRHFPSRQHLLEAAYVDEVETIAREADGLSDLEPWDALVEWLHRYVGYAITKRALADALLNYVDEDAPILQRCRDAIVAAGEPLLRRAQEAGTARPDATFMEVSRMVGGIALIRSSSPEEIERILTLALDGLRYRPEGTR